jgi:hypothetical protein
MKKSETSHPSIEYLMEYQAKAWESRSNIPQQELDRRKNLNGPREKKSLKQLLQLLFPKLLKSIIELDNFS